MQRQKGNNDAAFDLLRHCQTLNPKAPEVYFFLAQYYSGLRQTEKATEYIKQAAALAPENETYMETLAQTYIRQQDYASAIPYIRQQDYASAIPVIEGIYERNKDHQDLLEMLFQLYQQVGDNENAIEVLNRLEKIDGKSERLSQAKSELYTRMGDKKAAIAEMYSLAKQYPNDLNYQAMYGEALMMNLRTYYQSQGDRAIADSLTERVLLNRNATSEERIHLLRQEIAACEAADGDSTRVLELFHKMLSMPQSDPDMAILCASYMNAKKMPKDSIRQVLEKIRDGVLLLSRYCLLQTREP